MYVNSTGIKYKWKRNSSEKMIQIVIDEKSVFLFYVPVRLDPRTMEKYSVMIYTAQRPLEHKGKSARQIPKESYLTNIFVIGIGVDFSAV